MLLDHLESVQLHPSLFLNTDSPIQTGWALSWPQSSHTFQLMLYPSMGCSPLSSLCPSSYVHLTLRFHSHMKLSHTIATHGGICFSSPSGTWWYVILCSSFICLSFLPPNCKLSKERNEIFSFPHFLSIVPITEYFLMNWIGEFIIILQLGKQWQPVRKELSHSHPVTEMEKC